MRTVEGSGVIMMSTRATRRQLFFGAASIPLLIGLGGAAIAQTIAELEEAVRIAGARLRVAEDRHARGEIPYSYVEARQRELADAQNALAQAKGGGGTQTANNDTSQSQSNDTGSSPSSSQTGADPGPIAGQFGWPLARPRPSPPDPPWVA